MLILGGWRIKIFDLISFRIHFMVCTYRVAIIICPIVTHTLKWIDEQQVQVPRKLPSNGRADAKATDGYLLDAYGFTLPQTWLQLPGKAPLA